MNSRWKLPIHSSAFKLLLLMLLTGLIPFAAAMIYYDQFTAGRNVDAYAHLADRSHQYMLRQLQYRMSEMTAIADVLASDMALQIYYNHSQNAMEGADGAGEGPPSSLEETEMQADGGIPHGEVDSEAGEGRIPFAGREAEVPLVSTDESAMRDYIHELMLRQARRLGDDTQICLLGMGDERSVCIYPDERFADLEMFDPEHVTGFMPIDIRDSYNRRDYELMYFRQLVTIADPSQQGRVVVMMNVSQFMSDMLRSEQALTIGLHIMDVQGHVLYRTGPRFDGENMRGDTDAYGLEITDQAITSYQRFYVDGAEWSSVYQVKNQHVVNRYTALRNSIIIFAVLFVLLCVSGVLLFSRSMTKPLHRLRTLMNRAERGDLKAYWVHDNSREIDEVGQSYNQMLNRLEDLINQVKKEEALKKEAEIAALQYQLNPHFLYNTLNTIKWVAKLHKTPQISEVVSALVRLLQASLGKKGDFITLREETGLIHDYMEIQRFRYGDRVQVQFDLEPETERCLVPCMILQPLIENACIHGIEPSKREGLIAIRAWIDRDLLFCEVQDNGIGMDQVNESAGADGAGALKGRMSGIGLQHIREKIKLYYGPDYKMYVTSKRGKGTTIRLSLPIHQSEV